AAGGLSQARGQRRDTVHQAGVPRRHRCRLGRGRCRGQDVRDVVLPSHAGRRPFRRRRAPRASPGELSVGVEQLTPGARNGSGGDLRRLEERVAQTPEGWWKSADLCATTAAAFAELSQFDRAVEYFDIAATAERALGTV